MLLLDAGVVGEDWTDAGTVGEKERLSVSKEQLMVVVGNCCCLRRERVVGMAVF